MRASIQSNAIFPSGEKHSLMRLGVPVKELAKTAKTDLVVYEEDGLGTFKGFILKLECGEQVFLSQSDYRSDKRFYEDNAHSGPVVYVDAQSALKHGYENLKNRVIEKLEISDDSVDAEPSNITAWKNDARRLLKIND